MSERIDDIIRQIARLRGRNPVRQAAVQALTTGASTQEQVEVTARALCSASMLRGRERTVATWALGRMALTEEQRQAAAGELCRFVEREMKVQKGPRRLARWAARGMLVSLAFAVALLAADVHVYEETVSGWEFWPDTLGFCVLFTGIFSPVTYCMSLVADSSRFARVRSALQALGALRAPETAATLAAAAMHDPVRKEAVMALREVASTLTPLHYAAPDHRVVPNLCRLLVRANQLYNEETALAALRALKVVGDGRALPAVERTLAQAWTLQVRAETEEALRAIRKRVHEAKDTALLLRPSGPPEESALLRAAGGVGTYTPEALLRPIQAGHK